MKHPSKSKSGRLPIALLVSVGALTISAFAGCASLLGDFEVVPAEAEAGVDGSRGAENGAPCQGASECASGFCADGVCCESACAGTCESCALAEKGRCLPHPADTDPEEECRPTPRPDAGELEIDAGDDPDGGDAGSLTIHLPDGGVTSNDEVCAGSCDGDRRCKFPAAEKTCGTKFCNTAAEAARFACDGQGRCELGLATCQAYACGDDECRRSCVGPEDCAPTHFCSSSGSCQQKLADSVTCGSPNECKSGFCVSGVCCNSECDSTKIPGAVCNKAGSVGQCKCSLDCGAGSCIVFYPDKDKDGYGDQTATLSTGAVVACDNAPPAGMVLDHTDCADDDARAHPGQAGFFGTPILGTSSFDFNCDGKTSKKYREFPSATCHLCGPTPLCLDRSSTCTTASAQGVLACEHTSFLCGISPGGQVQFCESCTGQTGFIFGDSPIDNSEGFTQAVACGAYSSTYVTCSKCPTPPSGTVASTTSSRQQLCR